MPTPPSPPRTPSAASWHARSPSPPYDDRPVIATDDRGMVIEHGETSRPSTRQVRVVKETKPRTKRPPVQYVSKHFAPDDLLPARANSLSRKKKRTAIKDQSGTLATPPRTPAKIRPRIFYGLDVDALSSDSSLTDVPDNIGPDPFSIPTHPVEIVAVKTTRTPKKARHSTTSSYFPTPHKARPYFLSALPFPPISNTTFGLMQERLAKRPFDLLLATIFLNKTPGERAMPVCYELLFEYPTPEALSKAEVENITSTIRHLGFQNQRAHKIVGLAKGWIEREPYHGVRYRKVDYPCKGDGRNIKPDEPIEDDDGRVGWEISHLPGLGPYSHDSWRMFCRDILRGVATGYNGEGADEGFEPEWKRVLPKDKELRAWMTWMWMKEGWVWNCETGKRTKATEELMEMARGGGIVVEEHEEGKEILRLEQGFDIYGSLTKMPQRPAGEILDEVKAEA